MTKYQKIGILYNEIKVKRIRKMINLLLCGNKKVFDGALTQLISMTKRTQETINCYILTMDLSRLKPEYVCITDEQVEFLNEVIKSKNPQNKVTKIDVTNLYEEEFMKCKNESAYCTPYTLLRLLIDEIPNIPDKILYLDIDMMIGDDISKLYNIDIDGYEYAAVREKYGSKIIRPDYINAGMLLLNMKKIRETGLLEKARALIKTKKMLFADQDAVSFTHFPNSFSYKSVTSIFVTLFSLFLDFTTCCKKDICSSFISVYSGFIRVKFIVKI